MLATSWSAKGLLQPIWAKMDVPKERREELGRRANIPASNLSAMNTGERPMTMEMASRLIGAVPGLSLLDLGAPEAVVAAAAPQALDRLQEVEAQADRNRATIERILKALDDAGIEVPDAA